MWRRRNRNTIYPFISGAGTTALVVFMIATAFAQFTAMRDRLDAGRSATGEWQTLMAPHVARDETSEFSIAFSGLNAEAAYGRN